MPRANAIGTRSNSCCLVIASCSVCLPTFTKCNCLVVINWSVVDLMCGNVTHRNLVDKGQKRTHTGKLATVRCRLLSGSSCSIVSSPPVTNGLIVRLRQALSSVSIASVSTTPSCAETRFGPAGSGGAGCPSLGSDLRRPVLSCTQELETCSASF